MEQRQGEGENDQRLRSDQHGKARSFGFRPADQSACRRMIDAMRINGKCGEDRGRGHRRHREENRSQSEQVTEGTGEQCSRDITGVIERLVATELMRESALPDQAEGHPRHGGTDRGAGDAVDDLRARCRQERREDQNNHRRRDHGQGRHDHQPSLRLGTIDEGTERRGGDHAGVTADRHYHADLGRRPAFFLQEHAEERAESVAHVGHEKVERIERKQRLHHLGCHLFSAGERRRVGGGRILGVRRRGHIRHVSAAFCGCRGLARPAMREN
jgi:hypothetical protein